MPECLCLYPYVWTFLAWPSIRAECTEGGQRSACRPTQWTLEGRFILHHYLVLKDHSESEGAGCLQSFVHTENTLLSSSQSLIYPLNPYLSIASGRILLSHVINLFSVWLVESQGKNVSYLLCLLYQYFITFLTQIVSPQWYNSVFKSIEEASNESHRHFDVLKLLNANLYILEIHAWVWQISCLHIKQPQIASRPQGWDPWCKHLKLCCSCATSWNKLVP